MKVAIVGGRIGDMPLAQSLLHSGIADFVGGERVYTGHHVVRF